MTSKDITPTDPDAPDEEPEPKADEAKAAEAKVERKSNTGNRMRGWSDRNLKTDVVAVTWEAPS